MSWKKYFRPVNSALPAPTAYSDPSSSVSNFSSWLPEYYQGPPNRIMRYLQYDQMDMDHEISAALDTLADFSTHLDEDTGVPFEINYSEDASPSEIEVLEKSLKQWCNLNEFDRRLFRIFRSVLKYGDQFFIRHPRTYKLHWVDPSTVEKVLVNESQGKKVESFFIKDLDLNLQSLTASNMNRKTQRGYDSADTVFPNVPYTGQVGGGGYGNMSSYGGVDYAEGEAFQVDSTHVVHMTLSEGMTSSWPFGISILETVFKVYKQKELLEDSILIYRIHRAPERRIFYIDTGTMPPNKAAQYLERVRYEVQQKRIPSRTGGGQCFAMDTKVPLLDGRTLTIAELTKEHAEGKKNWAYSCDPVTGEPMPGLVSWAGVTKKDTSVIKVTLDNGESIICTPEHNFPVLGKGKVKAKDLVVNEDNLISFHTRMKSINEKNDNASEYEQVFDHSDKKWKFTHRVVARYMKELGKHQELIFRKTAKDKSKNVIHHGDYNKFNNNPENLYFMNGRDHFYLHARYSGWHMFTEERKAEAINKRLETLANRTEEEKAQASKQRSEIAKTFWAKIKSDPVEYNKHKERLTEHLSKIESPPFDNKSVVVNDRMFEIITEYTISENPTRKGLCDLLKSDKEFMELYENLNFDDSNKINKIDPNGISRDSILKIVKNHGYKDWRHFVRSHGLKTIQPVRKLRWEQKQLSYFVDIVKKEGISSKNDAVKRLQNDSKFMKWFAELNKNIKGNSKTTNFSGNTFNVFLNEFGYANWSDFKNKLELFNHKVVSIEYLEDKIDVGTLTIDRDEEFHPHHTFALETGVYTYNSITDAAYNPLSSLEDYYFAVSAEGRGSKVETLPGGENLGCFSLDTKVKLMDGRDLSISEISEELKQGEELWTYSCHPVTGEVAPGFISWAGKTRSQADVVKITLDSGDEIVCTPDHNFPIKGVGFVEAKDLSVGESLIPLYIEGDLIYCPHKKTWVSKTTFGVPTQEQEKDVELNHKIAAIEYLEEKLDVGTLTVDITEEYHDYHTYALSVGVFVKNSIDDLRYFNNKMMRALGVPSGYLPTGPEDGTNAYSDGRVGAAFIQEFRFSRVCQRYQRLIAPVFDREFKLFLKHRGIEVDNSIFSLSFTPPQNFSEYRKLELDSAYANLYNSVAANENLSRRFALKKYLGLSESEIAENERLWREENDVSHLTQDKRPGLDMRQADIRAPMDTDFDDFGFGDPDIGEPDIGGIDVGEPDIGGDEI